MRANRPGKMSVSQTPNPENHIACAMLVWARLIQIAYQTGQTIYQIKNGLLDDYLIAQLKNPTWKMENA